MRRTRNDGTKVWHNPELDPVGRRRGAAAPGEVADDGRDGKQHRAALEALFTPKPVREAAATGSPPDGAPAAPRATAGPDASAARPGARSTRRIAGTGTPSEVDPRAAERQRLLQRLLLADGRPRISKVANDFVRAGFTFPDEQDVHLQLLEHGDEERVCASIEALAALVAEEPPHRLCVLESRLRRIEEYAEDAGTRAAAERLRRTVTGRTPAPPVVTRADAAPAPIPADRARHAAEADRAPRATAEGPAPRRTDADPAPPGSSS